METILSLFDRYGIFAMIVIIFLEYACFPISSELVLPFSGAVARMEGISFFLLLPLSVLAGLFGTGLCYLAGRIGGDAILTKLVTRFPKTEHAIASSRKKFETYGAGAVCIGRVIPLCRTYIAFVAGAVGQSPSVYFPYSFLGITIWNSALLSFGYFLQDNWGAVSGYYARYKQYVIPVLLIGIALIILLKRRKYHTSSDVSHK
ncbi:MAG: DedA family protein [Lachnospiraceae bacterium]|nr:DedA family protein [Lachnospiraceae bacterium]